MRRTRGGARRWARWSTLALVVGVLAAFAFRSNVALLATSGTSMAPRFHSGDLAITLAASNYKVGDIVAYQGGPTGQVVLHRIVEHQGDTYRFKGDNNSWVDPVLPTTKDLVGKLWLHVPRAGALITLRAHLWQLALLVVAAMLLLGGKTAHRRKRRNAEEDENPQKAPRRVSEVGDLTHALMLPGAAVLVCLILAIVAFQRPATSETTASRDYTQTVRFGYTASAPSGITYPDGVVTTGSPIFLKLVSSLKFQLTYDVSAKSGMVHNAGGTYSIDAVVDGPASWHRSIPLQAATPFTGETFSTEVVVDIPQIRQIAAANIAETGMKADALVIRVVPTVSTNGFIDGAPFATTFAKGLTMDVGPTTVSLSTEGKAAAPAATSPGGNMMPSSTAETEGAPIPDQLTATASAKYDAPSTKTNRFELFSRRLDVSRARLLTGVALAMALVWMAVVAATQDRLRQRPESARISHRYRERIVGVTSLSDVDHVVDVANIAALVKIAEQGTRFIMHLENEATDMFAVDDDGIRYRYLPGAASAPSVRADTPPPVPVRAPVVAPLAAEPLLVAVPPTFVAPVAAPVPPTFVAPVAAPVVAPDPEPEPEPNVLSGLFPAPGDGAESEGVVADAAFHALLAVGGFLETVTPHEPATPPPYVGVPPPYVSESAPEIQVQSLDQALNLTPLSDAERDEFGDFGGIDVSRR